MKLTPFLFAMLFCARSVWSQDHGHLEIGAYEQTQGAQLFFWNGPDLAGTNGFVKTLTLTNSGPQAGYYVGNLTLTVLAATSNHGGPDEFAPALGSFIRARITSVKGPSGGVFSFWESNSISPTISLASGQTGSEGFRVTQNAGSPGTDPFGHIHGRRFTATKPGIYTVAFQAFDTSTNGALGGPIHTTSDVIEVFFQAGISIASLSLVTNTAIVTFGSVANHNHWLESNTNLTNVNGWVNASGPVSGTDYLLALIDTNVPVDKRFYRIRSEMP